jgi:Na+-driven multidrug efflux pump
VGYARQFMTVIALIWPFSLLEMTGMIAILRAGGDGKTGFYSDIVIMWIICIPLAALSAFVLKLPPVVTVAIIKMMIVMEATVGVVRVLSMKWIKDLTHR